MLTLTELVVVMGGCILGAGLLWLSSGILAGYRPIPSEVVTLVPALASRKLKWRPKLITALSMAGAHGCFTAALVAAQGWNWMTLVIANVLLLGLDVMMIRHYRR
jgi:hypothetical protein